MTISQFDKNFKSRFTELHPWPTKHPIHIDRSECKAVLFDIYGTLLISAAGEISSHEEVKNSEFTVSSPIFNALNLPADFSLRASFYDTVKKEHTWMKNNGVKFPEIDSRDIWDSILTPFIQRDFLNFSSREDYLETVAVEFELSSNPVWLMPQMKETLLSLKEGGIISGIVSNAQFYTPLILMHLTGCSNLSEIGFKGQSCIWSWEEKRGKPDSHLFEKAYKSLSSSGLRREEIIYIGNDMYKDIYPAASAGFKTCLFAGDARSLRLRKDRAECADLSPDYTITNLTQILDIMGMK